MRNWSSESYKHILLVFVQATRSTDPRLAAHIELNRALLDESEHQRASGACKRPQSTSRLPSWRKPAGFYPSGYPAGDRRDPTAFGGSSSEIRANRFARGIAYRCPNVDDERIPPRSWSDEPIRQRKMVAGYSPHQIGPLTQNVKRAFALILAFASRGSTVMEARGRVIVREDSPPRPSQRSLSVLRLLNAPTAFPNRRAQLGKVPRRAE